MTNTEKSRQLVVVTGTSGRLGAAISRQLIADEFRVVGIARRAVEGSDISSDAEAYTHISADLGDLDSIADVAKEIVGTAGKPYGLVNNAALGTDGLLATMHNSDIETVVRVNVTAPLILTKFLVRHMLAARTGRIVNVSSVVARTGYRGLAAYGATKAAMEGFTRSMARDVGPRGVTVNAVAPGFMDTAMTSGLGDSQLESIQRRSALGRFATVDEVAASVGYLMSDAGGGLTGSVITVDAGSTA